MKWKDLLKYPPRYFYDAQNRTLGLDGHWGGFYNKKCGTKGVDIRLEICDDIYYYGDGQLNLYLGDNFSRHPNSGFVTPMLFSESYVTVSPENTEYYFLFAIDKTRFFTIPESVEKEPAEGWMFMPAMMLSVAAWWNLLR